MKVVVDELKCETAGICVKECPEVFRFRQGSKRAFATEEEIPLSLQDRCRRAAESCPTKAIQILE